MPLIVHTNKKRVIRLGNYEKVQMAHIKTVSYFILKTFCDANESDATENEHVHRIHSAFFGVCVRWMPFFISSDFFSHSSWSLCAAFFSIFIWLVCFRLERRLCGHIWSGCCTDYSLSFSSFFCWFCLSASVDLFFFCMKEMRRRISNLIIQQWFFSTHNFIAFYNLFLISFIFFTFSFQLHTILYHIILTIPYHSIPFQTTL